MNDKDLVSIIIPIFNREKYLDNCITSILNQKYKNYEIILINDGSLDRSGEICDKYKERNKNIIVVHTSNNGVSHARNIGIELAHGKWICFIDSDDVVTDKWLTSFMNHADADLLIQGIQIKSTEKKSKCIYIDEEYKIDDERYHLACKLKRHNLLNSPFKCFRACIIKDNKIKFQEGMNLGEDYVFVITFMKHSQSIHCIPDCNYIYNQENSNLSIRFYPADSIIRWNNISMDTTLSFCKNDTQNLFFKIESKDLFCSKCRYTGKFYNRLSNVDKNNIFLMLRRHKDNIDIRSIPIKYWIFYIALINKRLFYSITYLIFLLKN